MPMPSSEIITIGDEILYGQTLDTNSKWMAFELDKIGVKVLQITSIADEEEAILNTIKVAEQRVGIILITGGLGPTKDDITKKTIAKYFDSKLKINKKALADVTTFFKQRGKELTELNRQQAAIPGSCKPITNNIGTAPGMWFEKGEKIFVSMPGVPYEMKEMMSQYVLPILKNKFNHSAIYHKIVHTVGIGESFLSEKISEWQDQLPANIGLAWLPTLGTVRLRLTAIGQDEALLKEQTEAEIGKVKHIISKYIFGYDDDTLEKVVGALLRDQNKTIAVAESCTGGYLAHQFTSVAGSSDYFIGSIVAYHNDIKIKELDVKPVSIDMHGVVSEQVVIEMAEGIKKKFQTRIGLSSSGIAGPTGGTHDKPVGTVWIACADERGTVTKKLMLGNDTQAGLPARLSGGQARYKPSQWQAGWTNSSGREKNIKLAAIAALNLVRQRLIENG
ncbi:MAG: competence/damage-inducible protein A [Cytophagales bacterium]|nr:competence/damage-inducible protein A [Cytophagales bacterium]